MYNGVDESNIIVNKQYHEKETVFLLAGRISSEKGQKEAVLAADILLERGIRNFKIIFAGKQVEELQIPNRLKSNVKYIGMVNNMPLLRRDRCRVGLFKGGGVWKSYNRSYVGGYSCNWE